MFGLDLDGWNTAMVVFLAIAASAATAVGVSQFVIIKLQKVSEIEAKQEFERYKLETGKKIAEANARQKEAELKLAEVREKLGRPRQINVEAFKEALVGVTPRPVIISYAPNDPDSIWLSLAIDGALRNAGWEVSTLIQMPDGIRECSNAFGGIYVLSKTLLPEEAKALQDGMLGANAPKTAFLKLPDAFNVSIEADSARFATCPFISDDRLHVAIWPRWVIFPKEK